MFRLRGGVLTMTETLSSLTKRVYSAWRRSEAYGCPMTQEGLAKAEQRYAGFQAGYLAGIRAAESALENEHSKNKKLHKFFFLAKERVALLRKV